MALAGVVHVTDADAAVKRPTRAPTGPVLRAGSHTKEGCRCRECPFR
jgi:hypothetical protein